MTNNNFQKALIYCRVSTKRQENEGGGLTSQEKRCRQYAAFHQYEIEEVFQDSYSGGGDFMKRPAMRDLLEYVDTHPHNHYVVIFDDLKRFARDLKFHWELREAFHSRNLTPECLNFKFEETPEGSFIETILAAQGELERKQNKRQVIQKMKARVERGIYCFGAAPFGYKYVASKEYGGKILALHGKEAQIVKDIYKGYLVGRFPHLKDIVEYVKSQKGIQKNRNVSKYSVTRVMSNSLYTGYVEYEAWNVSQRKGIHEAIISLDLFKKVQDKLENKLPVRTRRDTREDFPLRGLVVCEYCKKPFTASWSTGRSKKYPFYRCKGSGCIKKNKSISANVIHDNFDEYLQSLQPKIDIVDLILSSVSEATKSESIKIKKFLEKFEKELETVKQEKKIITERLIKATDETLIQVYENELKELQNRMLVLEERIANPKDSVCKKLEPISIEAINAVNNPYSFWNKTHLHNRRVILQTLFYGHLEYSKENRFGTAQKSYILRFYEQIGVNITPNLKRVDTDSETWNHFLDELRNLTVSLEEESSKDCKN